MPSDFALRPMRAEDIDAAETLFRLAFGTWFELPDPMQFRGDAALVQPRFWSYPDGGVVVTRGGALIGFGFASRWGSLGVLGPIAVRPELWRQGLAREIVAALVEIFGGWRSRLVGLFTFPESATHLRLYQQFGFWPRHPTPILAKPVDAAAAAASGAAGAISLLGATRDRAALVAECRALADASFAGLDLTREIDCVLDGRGDVLLLADKSRLDGFAICHTGPGSEGGTRSVYVKFALVRPGDGAPQRFERLVAAAEDFARARQVPQLSLGLSTGRHHAYRLLVERGYRTQLMGVMLHRPWAEAYDGPDNFIIDDWR